MCIASFCGLAMYHFTMMKKITKFEEEQKKMKEEIKSYREKFNADSSKSYALVP
eukprot:Pgem_evm1s16715